MHAPPLGNMLKNSFYECRATLSSYYICSSRENPLGNPARPIKLISNLPLAFFLSFILRVSISYYSQYASQFYSLRSCPRGGNRKKKRHRRNRLKKKINATQLLRRKRRIISRIVPSQRLATAPSSTPIIIESHPRLARTRWNGSTCVETSRHAKGLRERAQRYCRSVASPPPHSPSAPLPARSSLRRALERPAGELHSSTLCSLPPPPARGTAAFSTVSATADNTLSLASQPPTNLSSWSITSVCRCTRDIIGRYHVSGSTFSSRLRGEGGRAFVRD